MPLTSVGSLILDSLQFTTDPAVYEPLKWPRRYSVHPVIGGGVVIQDFGVVQRDNTLRLESGEYNILDETVVQGLHTRYRALGTVYTLTDWLNNQFTVFIKDFTPTPVKQGIDRHGVQSSLYRYVLDLHVIAIVKLFNVAFVGS